MEQIVVTHKDQTSFVLKSKENMTSFSATQTVELLGGDVIDMTVESATRLQFLIGDKIVLFGRDYTLNNLARETKKGERIYMYEIQWEGSQYDLMRANYSVNVDTTSNAVQDLSGESLTGDLEMFLTVLLSNIERVFPGKWALGTYPQNTDTKTITFGETDNCLTVLQMLCSESYYNAEFNIAIDQSGDRVLNIEEVSNIFPQTLYYGKGKGLYELFRDKSSNSNIVTRLNVYGSNKNINTSKYRASRLCLPNKEKGESYLENAPSIATYGIWEQTKIFEDVFPHRTGTVTSLGGFELYFHDSSMDFNLNEVDVNGDTLYLIPGSSPKIHFNTGNLAGYEFEIESYFQTLKSFQIKPFTDENGYRFPSETDAAFQISVGDEYVLTNIFMPQSYIDTAETLLQIKGGNHLAKYCNPWITYGLNIDPIFLRDVLAADPDSNIIWVGDLIHVVDSAMQINKFVRVKSFTRDLINVFKYDITISDIPVSLNSIIDNLVHQVANIQNAVGLNRLNDPSRARRNFRNAQDVVDLVFDPLGEYYPSKIPLMSIDVNHLSIGAKYTSFSVDSLIFLVNYNGEKNRVKYNSGTLNHYSILTNGAPTIWNISSGDVVMLTDGGYYVYAKCNKSSTSGTVYFSSTKILVDENSSYYHFLLGYLNPVGTHNERALALLFGFSTINGRYINTGRIQSILGTHYFDIDTGEMKGDHITKAGKIIEWEIAKKSNALFSDTFNVLQAQFDAQYTNYAGSGECNIRTVSDGTGGKILRIGDSSGSDQVVLIGNDSIPFDPEKLYYVRARIRCNDGDTGKLYVGIAGRNDKDDGYINVSGANSYANQFCVAASDISPTTAWVEYKGYFRGFGTYIPNALDPTSPSGLHANVRFIRPMLIANFENLSGTTDVDYIEIGFAEGIVHQGNTNLPGVLAAGIIQSDGSRFNEWGAKLSNGAVSKGGTGVYIIPHNVGHSNFSVQITCSASGYIAAVTSRSSTSITVTIIDSLRTPSDIQFEYLIIGSNL